MHDGGSAHKTKTAQKWLKDNKIPALHWLSNSPDLNPIENALNQLKNKVQDVQVSNIDELQAALSGAYRHRLFCQTGRLMPTRLQKVLKAKG